MSLDTSKQIHTILLKTESPSNSSSEKTDRYIDYLTNEARIPGLFRINQVNLLSFELINKDSLCRKLWQLIFTKNAYKCLILTSKQTLEAIEISIKSLIDTKITEITEVVTNSSFECVKKLNVYCVGQATANRFNQLVDKVMQESNVNMGSFFNHERFIVKQATSLSNEASPKHSKNAIELSKLIVKDYDESLKGKL